MSARYVPFESPSEFCRRRLCELRQSPEWGQFGKMGVSDFIKMIEGEFYDCADVPVEGARELATDGSATGHG